MDAHVCRACHSASGQLVLDLGDQPASDYFPGAGAPGPDPVYPLRMWLCSSCALAQLMADPTVPEEPRGREPAALRAQAVAAVGQVAAAGLLPAGGVVAEYGSPHGGSWLGLLAERGLTESRTGQADVVLDCFGLMHAADQGAALAERATRLAPHGVLLLQYHALSTIVGARQWNALRHGHFAYYSAVALTTMLARTGLRPRTAWQSGLYGGTVLLAATRDGGPPGPADEAVAALLAEDARIGVTTPAAYVPLQREVRRHSRAVHDWLVAQRAAGAAVVGYGAASRAVALLCSAHLDHDLLPAVIDASPAKQGLRMPGTDIPVTGPGELTAHAPVTVLLLVPDLMAEVRSAYPEVERAGGRWVDVQTLS